MATIASLLVKLGIDTSEFDAGVEGAKSRAEGLGKSLESTGKKMTSAGTAMTAGFTVPIVALGGTVLKMGVDFNAGMANVATMIPDNIERVEELGSAVQDMSVEVGKSTDDLVGGLYQVLSAFGDSADTVDILRINAKAATAGLATTEEAIALTSAVTKGYGDTTAGAVQHVSDLAFMAVKLGQTTFPELASSIGRVTPLASELGVSQEELFGVMATATGVTGNAAEVSTQLRGTLQALMAPTETMTALFDELGYANGEAMLESLGLSDTLLAITDAAARSDTPLQKYIGSIEGQTLALALSGSLYDQFTDKLGAMEDVVGATDTAFRQQSEGVNEAGFRMGQFQQRLMVTAQNLGQMLIPVLMLVMDRLEPMFDLVAQGIEWFGALDPQIQMAGIAGLGLVAALGPLLIVLGMIVGAVGALLPVLAAIALPVLAIIAVVGALYLAWTNNFLGIQEIAAAVLDWLITAFHNVVAWVQTNWPIIQQTITDVVAAIVEAFQGAVAWVQTTWLAIAAAVTGAVQTIQRIVGPIVTDIVSFILRLWGIVVGWVQTNWPLIQQTIATVMEFINQVIVVNLEEIQAKIAEGLAIITFLWDTFGATIMGMVEAVWTWISSVISLAMDSILIVIETAWNIAKLVIEWALSTILDLVTLAMQIITGDWEGAWNTFVGILERTWDSILGIVRVGVNGVIRLLNRLIGAWNALEFHIPGFGVDLPSVDIPGVGTIGGGSLGWEGLTVSTPDLPMIPALAAGGIATRPTLAMIGEQETEAVVPLSRLGSFGGNTTVNVYVQGSVMAERDLAATVRDELLRLGRRNLSVGLA